VGPEIDTASSLSTAKAFFQQRDKVREPAGGESERASVRVKRERNGPLAGGTATRMHMHMHMHMHMPPFVPHTPRVLTTPTLASCTHRRFKQTRSSARAWRRARRSGCRSRTGWAASGATFHPLLHFTPFFTLHFLFLLRSSSPFPIFFFLPSFLFSIPHLPTLVVHIYSLTSVMGTAAAAPTAAAAKPAPALAPQAPSAGASTSPAMSPQASTSRALFTPTTFLSRTARPHSPSLGRGLRFRIQPRWAVRCRSKSGKRSSTSPATGWGCHMVAL